MINANYWLSLPQEKRQKLIEAFNMRKVNGVISDSIRGVIDDGYISTLYGVFSIENMQRYTGSKDKDAYVLFNLCLDKACNPVVEPVAEVKTQEEAVEPQAPIKKTKKIKK